MEKKQVSNAELTPFVNRATTAAALTGIALGLILSVYNGNAPGVSLLITAIMGLVFGLTTRWLMVGIIKAWLETKLEAVLKEREREKAAAATAAARQAKATPGNG